MLLSRLSKDCGSNVCKVYKKNNHKRRKVNVLNYRSIEISQKAEIKKLITKDKVLEFAHCSSD